MSDISPELDALACNLIGAGAGLLEDGEDFGVMVATDCEDECVSFEDDTPDGCYLAACDHVRSLGKRCTRYALLYAGMVQEEEGASSLDALLVEFAERGMAHAWSGYVLYRFGEDGVLEMTDPLPAGQETLLFK